ncbi:hypothetical protein [Clostridium cibarium]|uniref:DUF4355 domain-containing protein n=1 Tax=Clostridium cibarium TaxID=2762247 RepID=A0ABR8PNI3_9CLOT|nr:hypothetical protein [Clostridium cibarium]MBD7909740.1 hypothetical protein [Clostridium cibarium]
MGLNERNGIDMNIEELGLEGDVLENVKKLLQGEGDRVRTEYSKKIKELEGKVPKEKSQEELTIEARLKAIEDKEKELTKRERLNKVSSKLKEKGLNEGLSKYLHIGDDIDDEGLNNYLDGIASILGSNENGYKAKGHEGKTNAITKEQFNQMSYQERADLYSTNKTLFDQLSK